MSITQKIKHEVVTVMSLTCYFGLWLGILSLIKYLLLAQYEIALTDFSVALIGAMVLAKVVLVLEYVPMGSWVRARPAWVEVVLRTSLYVFGVFIVLLAEKGLHGMDEYGGFVPALTAIYEHTDISHIWLNIICLSGALLSYNMLSVVRRRLGKGVLLQMFLTPLPEESVDR